jgi:predicted lipoprotein
VNRLTISISAAAVVACLAGLVSAGPAIEARAGGAPLSKRAALDDIAKRVLLPGYTDLAARSAELSTAIDTLTTTPTTASLARARQAWSATLLAWRRTQAFAHGPVIDLNVSSRIQFWPSRRTSVDRVLRSDRPIDDRFVRELGANAVGLSALEVLLFDDRRDDRLQLAALAGAGGERGRQYLRTLGRELAQETRRVADAWQGAGGYAAKFNAGGQDSLNLLVNDLLAAIELGAQNRLRIVVDQHRAQASRPDLIEGALSGTSQSGVLALLVGARAVFSGGQGVGLDDYLARIGPATARRIDDRFQSAIAAVRAIDGPLEVAIGRQAGAVDRAHAECRALEILLKTEVASVLGVTLTFKATDGD